jgi:hypothetical protein
MATTVVITSNPATTVSLKPANKSFATVGLSPSSNISLGNLTDVDVSAADDGETLVYSVANAKFEASSPTVTLITGGKF